MAVNTFNRVPPGQPSRDQPPGDGFLFNHGFSVLSIGWQWDVYRDEALLGLQAPPVLEDGQPVTGQAVVEIRPNFLERTWLLANRLHQPYPVVDVDGAEAHLYIRDWEDGPETEIPRSEFRFAKESDGEIVPSAEHVYFERRIPTRQDLSHRVRGRGLRHGGRGTAGRPGGRRLAAPPIRTEPV